MCATPRSGKALVDTLQACPYREIELLNYQSELSPVRGTSNVFEDLGLPDAAERLAKTRQALAVNEILKARKFKQRDAAELLRISQRRVSALMNYRLDQFSSERLSEFLSTLHNPAQ